ncbi:MAG: hypothetical protein LBB68_06470 [Treponema sp.]|jgi:DNA mismatch repair protein MutS2|nr:hypothetical protein [Treponema sp.]
MNEKVFQLLEFSAVLSRVASCSRSEEATALIRESRPLRVPKEVEGLKAHVQAVLGRINSGDEEPRSTIPSIGGILPKLKVAGASLEIDEAYALGLFVERGDDLKNWLEKGEGDPRNPRLVEKIH